MKKSIFVVVGVLLLFYPCLVGMGKQKMIFSLENCDCAISPGASENFFKEMIDSKNNDPMQKNWINLKKKFLPNNIKSIIQKTKDAFGLPKIVAQDNQSGIICMAYLENMITIDPKKGIKRIKYPKQLFNFNELGKGLTDSQFFIARIILAFIYELNGSESSAVPSHLKIQESNIDVWFTKEAARVKE